MAFSLGLEQKVSDEMRHKFLCASSLHHSVCDFLKLKPRQLINILVRDEFVVMNDSFLKLTAHPTAHTHRVLPHSSHPATRWNNRLIVPVFLFSSMIFLRENCLLLVASAMLLWLASYWAVLGWSGRLLRLPLAPRSLYPWLVASRSLFYIVVLASWFSGHNGRCIEKRGANGSRDIFVISHLVSIFHLYFASFALCITFHFYSTMCVL